MACFKPLARDWSARAAIKIKASATVEADAAGDAGPVSVPVDFDIRRLGGLAIGLALRDQAGELAAGDDPFDATNE